MTFIDIVIYHGCCPDGIAGAWSFWKYLLDKDLTKFHPGKFNERPPDVKDKNVVFIDFCYPKEKFLKVLEQCKNVIVLDHHKSSEFLNDIKSPKLQTVLDNNRSGCQIAWDYIFEEGNRPWFIDDIADRDLWKWKIKDSKTCLKALHSLDYLESIEKLDRLNDTEYTREDFVKIGKILITQDEKIVENLLKRALKCYISNGVDKWRCKLIDCSHYYASEVCTRLCEDSDIDFAMTYRYNLPTKDWICSLRAVKDDIDLDLVAKSFDKNGGGHKKASGMRLSGIINDYITIIKE